MERQIQMTSLPELFKRACAFGSQKLSVKDIQNQSPAYCFAAAENNRLQPLLARVEELIALVEFETNSEHCVCKLNVYTGAPTPCGTCRKREALVALRAECERMGGE